MCHFRRRRRWGRLSGGARRGITIAGAIQIALLASAIIDLARRPANQVRGGRKWAWFPILLVNFIDPTAYFLVGRKHAPVEPASRAPKTKNKK